MKHILYDMGNFLLKKIIFCQVNINFWRGTVEGGHNGEKNCIDFFHVSDHLEQFGRSFFSSKKLWKNYLFIIGKFRLNFFFIPFIRGLFKRTSSNQNGIDS